MQTKSRAAAAEEPARFPAAASAPGSRLTADERKPWYKQLWPWLIIAPPLASVLAGIAMVVLAVTSDDGLVTPDYYRQGVEINARLSREQAANCAVKDRACMNAPLKEDQ